MASTSKYTLSLQPNTHKTTFSLFPNPKPFPKTQNHSTKYSRIKSSSSLKNYEAVAVDEDMAKIRRLQNGSDVRGVALGGERGREVDLTVGAVEAISESFGEWLVERESREGEVRVSLGRDPRISGSMLSVGVFSGLAKAGCVAFDIGLATTPACFMSTMLSPFSYDASIMV